MRPRGFTLVEMVVALTVLSIIAMLAVPIINLAARAWQDAAIRRELGSELQLTQARLDDELSRALPGSARHRQVGARHWLEFMIVRASARARDGLDLALPVCPALCSLPGNNDSLEAGCSESCFRTLGPWVGDPLQPGVDWLVVHPRRPGAAGDPYLGGTAVVPGGIKSRITAVAAAAGGTRVDIAPATFASLAPSRRVWAIAEAVSYECDPGSARLLRHADYGIQATQPVNFAGAVTAQLAGDVSACRMVVTDDAAFAPRQQVALLMQVSRVTGGKAESMESLWQWTLREP